MTSAFRLGLRLAVGNGGQRARTIATGTASALGVVLVIAVWGLAASTLGTTTWFQHTRGPQTLLLAGTIAMVGLPVIVLVATIARLSASVRDRRLANLRLLGLTAGQTRVVAATEVGASSLVGTAIGATLAAAIAAVGGEVLLSRADLAGASLWPPALAWVVVPLAVASAALAPAVLPQRLPSARALSHVRQRAGGPVRLARVLPLVLGFLLCASPQVPLLDRSSTLETWEIVVTITGIALLGIGMLLVIPVFMALIAGCLLRFGQGPLTTLVGRRLQTQPASATRVIAALMMGLFIVVGARGVLVVFLATPQYVAAADFVEREQTAEVTATVPELQRTIDDLGALEGVKDVVAFPVAQGAPPKATADGSDSVTVVVATCAELATTTRGLPGCSDEAPSLVGDPWIMAPDAATLQVRASSGNAADGPAVDVDLRRAGIIAPEAFEREVGALADTPVIVVPPRTPGLTAMLTQTDRLVVAHAGPGRGLYERVEAAGYLYNSSVDLENYDFVQGMLTMVWILAAVVVTIGLATFTIAGIDRAIGRRRELTALRLIGTPHRLLRWAQWLEAALPTVLGSALAIAAGAYVGAAYLQRSDSLHVSLGSTLTLAAVAIVTSLLLAWVTTVGTAARLDPEHIRAE